MIYYCFFAGIKFVFILILQSEINMIKFKQKTPSCFRATKGGEIFCRIRSYIFTSRKLNHNVWEALDQAITKNSMKLYFPIEQ